MRSDSSPGRGDGKIVRPDQRDTAPLKRRRIDLPRADDRLDCVPADRDRHDADIAGRRRRRLAARIAVDLGRNPFLHDAPAVEHHHAIGRSELDDRRRRGDDGRPHHAKRPVKLIREIDALRRIDPLRESDRRRGWPA